MLDQIKKCPKCQSHMSDGYMIDRGHSGIALVPIWYSGEPVRSWWCGVKVGASEKHETRSYRCDRCGYIEHYAIG